ncbi:hypothetical protein [Pseudophaeobacter sp.]|uniref:hypothetical protein n=1 Tax=Pseudophaeobacter sp. TaxID=1971739 RepID=UPI00329A0F68
MARFYAIASLFFSSFLVATALPLKPAEAGGTINSFEEGKLAIELCSKLILSQEDGFDVLKARGYRVKEKRWGTVYKAGTGNFQLFGADGVEVRKSSQGCSITLLGMKQAEGNQLFRQFQSNFRSHGYRTSSSGNWWGRKQYLIKGSDKISYSGQLHQGGSVNIHFARTAENQ